MAKSYYSIALCFYQAKSAADTDDIEEHECRQALKFLMYDFSTKIRPLDKGQYYVQHDSGKAAIVENTKQLLRYLAQEHKGSMMWYPFSSRFAVTRLAKHLAVRNGYSEDCAPAYMDEAAKRCVAAYFRQSVVQEKLAMTT